MSETRKSKPRGPAWRPGTAPAAAAAESVDAQAVRDWLKSKGVREECPMCGHADLRVSKDFYAVICLNRVTNAPDLQRGSRVVRIRCANCGYVALFHARQIGLR